MSEREYRERMAAVHRKHERQAGIIAGVAVALIVLAAIAFRVGCASVCTSRGGRVVWTSSGEVVCLEPEGP